METTRSAVECRRSGPGTGFDPRIGVPVERARFTVSDRLAGGDCVRPWRRRRDRRRAFQDFLAYVAAGLSSPRTTVALRERFEDGLRRLMAAREVTIREGEDLGRESVNDPGLASICVDIPRGSPIPARIEATAERVATFDDWDRQTLKAARHLAALVLEVDEQRQRGSAYLAGLAGLSPARPDDPSMLVGSSSGIRQVRERIERVAATDFTVLIEGESGTGKELVARQIHERSRRRRGPFVAINCAALVESLLEAELFGIEDRTATGVRGRRGKFEHADQGTLFLDEVSDLSVSAQAKLLRAIQDLSVERVGGQGARRVDVRIVVATNRSLLDLVERGHFRLDLFYRLNGVEIVVPPLRERREDILELAHAFLDRYRHVRPLTMSPAVSDALLAYHWPGNVRELERVIERTVALSSSEQITLDDLPPVLAGDFADAARPAAGRDETMRAWGRRYARLVLGRCGNNKRQACAVLGISYHTLQAYLRHDAPGEQVPAAGEGQSLGQGGNGASREGELVAQTDAEEAVSPVIAPPVSRRGGAGPP